MLGSTHDAQGQRAFPPPCGEPHLHPHHGKGRGHQVSQSREGGEFLGFSMAREAGPLAISPGPLALAMTEHSPCAASKVLGNLPRAKARLRSSASCCAGAVFPPEPPQPGSLCPSIARLCSREPSRHISVIPARSESSARCIPGEGLGIVPPRCPAGSSLPMRRCWG